jgi:hypothetical protein
MIIQREKLMIPESKLLEIHNSIHHHLFGDYKVTPGANKCKSIEYNHCGTNIRFMEQNKSKNSSYAKLAREGHFITWGIRDNNWIYIHESPTGEIIIKNNK